MHQGIYCSSDLFLVETTENYIQRRPYIYILFIASNVLQLIYLYIYNKVNYTM